MDDFNERVRQRAYRLWVEEGCPEGRSDVHWDRARELVADEDDDKRTIKSSAAEEAMRGGGHNGGQHPSQNGGQHAAASEQPKQQTAPKRAAPAKVKTSGASKPPKDTGGTKRR